MRSISWWSRRIQDPCLTCWVTTGKSQNLLELQFPPLEKGGMRNVHFPGRCGTWEVCGKMGCLALGHRMAITASPSSASSTAVPGETKPLGGSKRNPFPQRGGIKHRWFCGGSDPGAVFLGSLVVRTQTRPGVKAKRRNNSELLGGQVEEIRGQEQSTNFQGSQATG